MPTPGQNQHLTLSFQFFRYGLVVRIPGSHPGGPGSIPGNGIFFISHVITISTKDSKKCFPTPGVEPGPPG